MRIMTLIDTGRARFRFAAKPLLAAALVVAFDQLLLFHEVGWTLGLFTFAWLVASVMAHPEVWRDKRALAAVAAALLSCVSLIEQPGLLGWALFCTTIALTILLPRVGPFGDVVDWALRLIWMGFAGLVAPWRDFIRVRQARLKLKSPPLLIRLTILILPIIGGIVFITLFVAANPVLAEMLENVRWPELDIIRAACWVAAATVVWTTLRPRRLRSGKMPVFAAPTVTVATASVTLSLILFNAIFAVQNGLDIAYLWSGAGLPPGVTLAQYAHRGAYPLIATTLLAGLFVIVFLRPGSQTAKLPLVRRMVVLWVAQNILLVASSILRILDYIDAYSLTRLRIAALLWMGLVGVGLALVCWRMLGEKSSAWLVNTNAAAAAAVLFAVSFVDLGAIAAGWNVRHAREMAGTGASLDIGYLQGLGPSALMPLLEVETRSPDPRLRSYAGGLRSDALHELERRQADWRAWTWRGARRLARYRQLVVEQPPVQNALQLTSAVAR